MPDDPSKSTDANAGSPSANVKYAEQRKHPRYAFIADAEVTELRTGARLKTRVSELSLRGCYVDTINPFPEGSSVRFCIVRERGAFDVLGKVIYVHPGYGMGVVFDDPDPDQSKLLEKWLAELAGQS